MKRLIIMLTFVATQALAVQPEEILDDPALEARAREISAGLRCLVCRNESIDESNADLARDLRLLVRERLTVGDSDAQVVAHIVDRYGEYVLLRPTMNGSTLLLWLAPGVLLLGGGAMAVAYIRRRALQQGTPTAETKLSAVEKARLEQILRD